jgi:hypothetical protein
MHPTEALTLSTLVTTEGVPAFPQLGATGGSILGIPAVTSVGAARSGSPSERVFAVVDGAQILVADDNAIEVSASNVASLQLDSATTQDARDGTSTSVISLFQTDSTAVKIGRTINWERAQDAAVAWCTVA